MKFFDQLIDVAQEEGHGKSWILKAGASKLHVPSALADFVARIFLLYAAWTVASAEHSWLTYTSLTLGLLMQLCISMRLTRKWDVHSKAYFDDHSSLWFYQKWATGVAACGCHGFFGPFAQAHFHNER